MRQRSLVSGPMVVRRHDASGTSWSPVLAGEDLLLGDWHMFEGEVFDEICLGPALRNAPHARQRVVIVYSPCLP